MPSSSTYQPSIVIPSSTLPRTATGLNYTSSYNPGPSTDYRRELERLYGAEVGRGSTRAAAAAASLSLQSSATGAAKTSPSKPSSPGQPRKSKVTYPLHRVPQFRSHALKACVTGGKYPYVLAASTTPPARKKKPRVTREEVGSVLWRPGTREEWDDCVEEMTTVSAMAR